MLHLLLSKKLKVLINSLSFVSISPQGLARVRRATEADSEMVFPKAVIQTWWPDTKEDIKVSIQCYLAVDGSRWFSVEG